MRIEGKNKKFWADIIQRRADPELVFKQNYVPDVKVARMLAQESMNAIKGGVKHKFSVQHINGKLVVAKFANGSYSTGIMKRKSPDGTDFIPLSPVTLEIRKMDGITRGPAFILRETGKHIMNGLKILTARETRNGSEVTVGWTGLDKIIAEDQNKGFDIEHTAQNKQSELRTWNVNVPARPFIGLSEELKSNLYSFWKKIAK